MNFMSKGLLVLLVGLGTAPFLASCEQSPTEPNGQVEIPGEEAPEGVTGEAPADPTVPDSAISPESDPSAQGEPADPAAQGGPSDLPPLEVEPIDPGAQAVPDAVEPDGAIEQPQDSELPLITEPDPSSDAAPPVE